jgi:hypothetical protein
MKTVEDKAQFIRFEPDLASMILGTGYDHFVSSTGMHGLGRETGERLDVLAVVTLSPGQGQFRQFIQEAKRFYQTICVWEDWNPIITGAMSRYGFTPMTDIQEGETLTGWRWDANADVCSGDGGKVRDD